MHIFKVKDFEYQKKHKRLFLNHKKLTNGLVDGYTNDVVWCNTTDGTDDQIIKIRSDKNPSMIVEFKWDISLSVKFRAGYSGCCFVFVYRKIAAESYQTCSTKLIEQTHRDLQPLIVLIRDE